MAYPRHTGGGADASHSILFLRRPTVDLARRAEGSRGGFAQGSSPDALTAAQRDEHARLARVGAGTVACRRVRLAARHGTALTRERSHCRAAVHARPAAPCARAVAEVATPRLAGEGRGGCRGA